MKIPDFYKQHQLLGQSDQKPEHFSCKPVHTFRSQLREDMTGCPAETMKKIRAFSCTGLSVLDTLAQEWHHPQRAQPIYISQQSTLYHTVQSEH